MLWLNLERCGILRMALVDHVFTDFIQKGLHKQDILDMMELYGLIAKFSCLSPDSKQEQRYFVPSQLTSSPSGLCEINPSQTDPCPLYLHFLDGFVPHGLFPQLLSKCTSWCSERGPKVPQLYHNGGRFFIGKQTIFDLILICGKRFIKVMLKQRNPDLAGQPSSTTSTAVEVRTFLMATLQDMSRDLSWLRNLQYNLCVACSCCLQSGEKCIKHGSVCSTYEDCLHLLQVPEEVLICPKSLSEETVQVHGLEKWFQIYKTEVFNAHFVKIIHLKAGNAILTFKSVDEILQPSTQAFSCRSLDLARTTSFPGSLFSASLNDKGGREERPWERGCGAKFRDVTAGIPLAIR